MLCENREVFQKITTFCFEWLCKMKGIPEFVEAFLEKINKREAECNA